MVPIADARNIIGGFRLTPFEAPLSELTYVFEPNVLSVPKIEADRKRDQSVS